MSCYSDTAIANLGTLRLKLSLCLEAFHKTDSLIHAQYERSSLNVYQQHQQLLAVLSGPSRVCRGISHPALFASFRAHLPYTDSIIPITSLPPLIKTSGWA
jgi:hypothetical protein